MATNFVIYHNPGSILKFSARKYVDQLDPSNNPYNNTRSNFITHIRNTYNISESEYCKLVIKGDINYVKICKSPKCSNEIIPVLKRGFLYDTCSQSCQCTVVQYRLVIEGTHPSYLEHNREANRERGKLSIYNALSAANNPINVAKRVSEGRHPFQSYEVRYRCSKSSYVTKHKDKSICYLYLTNYKGLIKFGITVSGYSRSRMGITLGAHKDPYESLHIIRSGSVDWITELEYKIKMELHPRNRNLGTTEVINRIDLKDLLEIVRNYK